MANDLLRERLPPGCHLGVTQDGRVFFINDHTRTTSWIHPVSGEPVLTGLSKNQDLPKGWEEDVANDGTIYYVDHNRHLTTFDHPVLGRPIETHSSGEHQSSEPYQPSSPASPTVKGEEQDNFKRGTFKQRSVKAPSSKRNPDSEVIKSGWLLRLETSGLTKTWKKRWCVLADFALFIYKGEDELVTLNSVLLPSYRINPCTEADNIKKNFVFKVEHENTKTLYFATEEPTEFNSWMSLLRHAAMMNGNGFQRDPGYNIRQHPMKSLNKSSSLPSANNGFSSSYTGYGDPAESPFIAPNDPFFSLQKDGLQRENRNQNQPGSLRNSLSNSSSHGAQNNPPTYSGSSGSHNQSQSSGRFLHGQVMPSANTQQLRDGFAPDSARNSLAQSDSSRAGQNSYSPIQAERQRSFEGKGQWVNGVYHKREDSYSDIDTPVKMLHKWDEGFPSMDDDRVKHSSFVELVDGSKGKHPETFNTRSKSHENFFRQPDSRSQNPPSQVRPGLLTQQQGRSSQSQDLRRSMTNGQQQQQRDHNDSSLSRSDPRRQTEPLPPLGGNSQVSSPGRSQPHQQGYPHQSKDPQRGSLRDTRDTRQQQMPPGQDRRSYTSNSSTGAQPPPGLNSSIRNSGQGQPDQRQTSQGSLSRQHQPGDSSFNQRSDSNNGSMNSIGHTYVNFPRRAHGDAPQQSKVFQQRGEVLPGRPPYPAAVRQQIVEELAQTKTPVTQNDFLTSSRMNTQRMEQPAYFQYPTPRDKHSATKMPWEENTKNNHGNPSQPRNQPNSRLSSSSRSSHPSSAGDQGGNPRSPQSSNNLMDPEAQKLRMAYERVSSLRLAPDKGSPHEYNGSDINRNSHSSIVMASEDDLEGPRRNYRSQEELDNYGKISPPMGSYIRIPDEPEDLYMRGSAFRPPSTPSGSMAGLDSLQRNQASSMDDGLQKFSRQNNIYMMSHNPDYEDDLDYYNLVPRSGRDSRNARPYHLKESLVGHKPYGDHLARQDHIDDHFARHDSVDDQFARHDSVDYHLILQDSVDNHLTRHDSVNNHFARYDHCVDNHFARQDHVDGHFARHKQIDDHINRGDQFTRPNHVDQFARDDHVEDHFAIHDLSEDWPVRQDQIDDRLSRHDQRDNHLGRSGSLKKNSLGGQYHIDDPYAKHDHSDSMSFKHNYVHGVGGRRAQIQQKHRHQVHRSPQLGQYNNTVSHPDSYSNINSPPNGLLAREAAEIKTWPEDRHYLMNMSAPPRRQPALIHTVKEDPNMSDREVLETNLQKVSKKNPLNGPRLRMSISAGDLIGKTHDELVLFLIQLRRNQAALDNMRDWYRSQLEQQRPMEMEYRRQVNQTGVIKDRRLMENHQNFLEAKGQMEEIENKLEVYKPIIILLDNMVTMGSLYGGDNLMLATQYRKHLLRPDQYQPPKKMLEFSRQNQEDRLIQNTEAQLKQLSSDEVDLEEKIDRLNELDRKLQEQSFRVSSYKEDKELMEKALSDVLRQQDQYRNDPREMRRLADQQRTLEREISRVTQQLAEASKELEETTVQNNKVEHEVALLRTKVHGELTRSKSTPTLASENARTKMMMEKELAKVEGMMQGLNEKGASLSQAMKTIRRSSSSSQLSAALDREESKKKGGTYLETDIDSGDQIDLATVVDVSSPDIHKPSINHQRQNAATHEDWDIEDADQNTKQYFGLIPKDKPKGLTVRDVKRQSEQRKERMKKDGDDMKEGEEIQLQVSNVDNEATSIIHARITPDPNGKTSGNNHWESGHPLYENLPKYTPVSSVVTSGTQPAPPVKRTSLILMAPKPFTPYQEKSARPFRSELALNTAGEPQFSSVKLVGSENLDPTKHYHSVETLNRPGAPKEESQAFMDRNNNGLMSSLEGRHYPTNSSTDQQSEKVATSTFTPSSSNLSNSLKKEGNKLNTDNWHEGQDPPPSAAHIQRPVNLVSTSTPGTYTAKPWSANKTEWENSLPNVKRSPRGRHLTISSSEPVKLEMKPTLHSAAGDLITNKLIDNVPDIVKSSQTKMDQIDTDMIDREILFLPEKVSIPERYDPEADAENLTEEDRVRRREKAERIKRVLASQSLLSMSQQDLSKLPPEDIHQRVEKEKNERAHYMNLHQELAHQVTQQSKKQAAARRKTWSGAQFAEIKKQYENNPV